MTVATGETPHTLASVDEFGVKNAISVGIAENVKGYVYGPTEEKI